MKNKLITIFFFLTFSFAQASDLHQISKEEINDLNKSKALIENESNQIKSIESNALRIPNSDAERSGNRLTIHLKNNSEINFDNKENCPYGREESKCYSYILVRHVNSIGLFLICKFFYESVNYIIVDQNSGNQTILPAFPIFSPSGKRIFIITNVNDDDNGPMEVWGKAGLGFKRDWRGSYDGGGLFTDYYFQGWDSDNLIKIETLTSFGPGKELVKKNLNLIFNLGKWSLQ